MKFYPTNVRVYAVYKSQVNENVLICIYSDDKLKADILIHKYKLYYYFIVLFCYQHNFMTTLLVTPNLYDKIIYFS